MMINAASRMEVGDPAPGARGHLVLLGFGVIASPIAWALALYTLYAVGSRDCFPGTSPRATGQWNADWILLAIACGALLICIVAGLISVRSWRVSYRENPSADALIQFGEGRTRFIAVWGAITSLLFGILMVASLIPLFVVPLCGS
jgi:hypothetical protein